MFIGFILLYIIQVHLYIYHCNVNLLFSVILIYVVLHNHFSLLQIIESMLLFWRVNHLTSCGCLILFIKPDAVYHIESIFEGIIQWITVWQTLTLVLVETEVKWSKYSDGCKGKMFLKNIIYLFIVSSSSIAAYWDWLQVLLSAWIVLSLIISKEQMQIHNLLLLAQ